MEEIEYGEHCFGSFIRIDGETLELQENDERGEEYVRQLKIKLIKELETVVDQINYYDLRNIAEIITQNNSNWEYIEEDSNSSSCDQCGNFNYNEKYRRSN
jgi:hypothetical protein